jgi:hypothetical protein
MAAQECDAEQDAKTHGVGDAEVGGVWISRVQITEQNAHWKHDGVGSKAAHQDLKGEPVKDHLFADCAAQKEQRHEKDGAPVGAGVVTGSHVGRVGKQRNAQDEQSRAYAAREAHQSVVSSFAIPGKTKISEGASAEDDQGKAVGHDSRCQAADCNTDQIASDPFKKRADQIDGENIEE